MVYIRVHSFLFFCMHRTACGILVPRPRIKPMPSAVRVQFQPLDHLGSPLEFTLDVVHSIGLDKDIFKKSREGRDSCIKSQPFFFPTFECSVAQSCLTLWLCPVAHRLPCSWDFPVKKTGMCCHFLLQGIFPSQGSNSHLLHCRQILYHWATGEALQILPSHSEH